MPVRICEECRKPVEPPFTVCRSRLPKEVWSEAERRGVPIVREFVICQECWDGIEESREISEELLRGVRAGTICLLCDEQLDPPGGWAVRSVDGKRMLRLCRGCRDGVERRRRSRGYPSSESSGF
jgi:hypothetical protein